MFHGERFRTTDEFVNCLEGYIQYWNNERLSLALDGMRSVQYRSRQQTVLSFFVHLLGCILTTWAGFRLRRCARSPRRRQIPFCCAMSCAEMSGALLRRSRLLCGDVAVRAVDNAVFKVLFAPPRDFDFVPLFLRAAVVYALKARAFRERAVANACHARGNLHRLKVLVQRKRAFSDFRNAVGDFERGQRLGVHIVFANQYHALRFHEAAKLFIHRAPLCKRSVVEYTRKVLAVF